MERCEEIEEPYLLALEADPNNMAVHSDYGNLLEEMGRYEEGYFCPTPRKGKISDEFYKNISICIL